jgi:Flp pilus assembly protein TadG
MKPQARSLPRKNAGMRLSALWRDERGGSAIEFALAFIPVVFIILAAIEFGLDMAVDATVQIAAQAASRAGMVTMTAPTSGQTTSQAAAQTIVMQYLGVWQNTGATVTVTRTNYAAFGGTASTNASYCGNVESYVIQVSNMPTFTGIGKWFGMTQLNFQRSFIVQNVCTTS